VCMKRERGPKCKEKLCSLGHFYFELTLMGTFVLCCPISVSFSSQVRRAINAREMAARQRPRRKELKRFGPRHGEGRAATVASPTWL